MRDLAARLRDIVRRESAATGGAGQVPPVSLRELTYVPDGYDVAVESIGGAGADPLGGPMEGTGGRGAMAERMGGTPIDEAGTCLMIDRHYAGDRSHGRHRIETCRPDRSSPIDLFDPRVTAVPDWWRHVVFFDIETTGLSGGAGTLAFLVGCAWFQADGSFIVRQFFLAGPSGEKAMLKALAGVFDEASLLVTYNGRTFDVPFMETRWAYHRTAAPTGDLPHFDMLPPARRLWGRRDLARPESDGCSLSAIERRVLGFHRHNDVPGFEIPARYFQFLRTGDAALVEGVLEHNRHDLVSLAAVMSHALWMVQEGPDVCREPAEQLAVGQIYERSGDLERAAGAYEMATRMGDADVQRPAWARLAVMHRRAGEFERSAAAWQRILDLVPRSRRALTTLERQAMQALAIHHEHRARDLDRARGYAEALSATTVGRHKADTERRLERLSRKIKSETVEGKLTLGYDADES